MHAPILKTQTLIWPNEQACERWAHTLANKKNIQLACLELVGSLGVGKTTLTRYLLQGLGITGRIKSPSYTILESYKTAQLPAWHFDFYRFEDPHEWEAAGFRDIFAQAGLKIIEWPEKARDYLPLPDLRLSLTIQSETQRAIRLEAFTALGTELLI